MFAGDKTLKKSGVASDGEFWISKVLATIKQLEKDTKHVTVITKFDEPTRALHVKARELAARLSKASSGLPDNCGSLLI
jgi:DNA polymerase phi